MSKRRRKRRKRNAKKSTARKSVAETSTAQQSAGDLPSAGGSVATPAKAETPTQIETPTKAETPPKPSQSADTSAAGASSAATTTPRRSGASGEVVVEARARSAAGAGAGAAGEQATSRKQRASRSKKGRSKQGARKQSKRGAREPIVPWRDRLRSLLERVRAGAREQGGQRLEAFLAERLGPEPHLEGDRERALDAFACLPGSADGEPSLVRRLAEEAGSLEAADRDQLLRWETERRQDVFLLQRAHADRLEAWDPVEGAGLTLHLLDRLGAGQAAQLVRGTVLTCAYLPYMARLVALPPVEFYAGSEPLSLYREQVKEAGRRWHDAPAPAPVAAP